MITKEKIQKDFVQAMKAKDEDRKRALSMLKSQISVAEKIKGTEADENMIFNTVVSLAKQRRDSIELFGRGDRQDLMEQEQKELDVLMEYMPEQFERGKIETIIREILDSMPEMPNPRARIGRTMGEFNKRYPEQLDVRMVNEVITELVGS